MMNVNKKSLLSYSMKLLVVAFSAVVFSNIIVWLAKTVTSGWSGKFGSVLVLVLALVLLEFSRRLRPGKEDVFDLIATALGVTILLGILGALGISFLSYVTDVSTIAGLAITASTIFLAETVYMKVKRKI